MRRKMTIKINGEPVTFSLDPRHFPTKTIKVRGTKGILVPLYPTPRLKAFFDKRKVDHTESDSGLTSITAHLFRPATEHPEEVSAQEYRRRCQELDRTEAGKRARKLLFNNLSPDQIKQVEIFHYFDVVIFHPEVGVGYQEIINGTALFDAAAYLPYVRVRIHRGEVIRNISLYVVNGKGRDTHVTSNICIQTAVPHPTDDIHLAQKLWVEQRPNEFIRIAQGIFASRMFSPRYKYYKPVELPHIRAEATKRWPTQPTRERAILAYIDHALDAV